MKHFINLLFLVLLCSAAERAAAQVNNNAVYLMPFNAANTVGPSASFRNIGQQYHILAVYTAAPSGCPPANYTGNVQLEASFDGVAWFIIGNPITQVTNSFAITSASGSYTYVRANYTDLFNGGSCNLTAHYSGSLTGTLTGSAPFTTFQDNFIYRIGQFTGGSTPTQIGACPLTTSYPVSAPQVYSVTLTSPGGANTVTLKDRNNNVSPTIYWTFNVGLAANDKFIQPQGSRPYLVFVPIVPPPLPLGIYITASAATEVDYAISYRCE